MLLATPKQGKAARTELVSLVATSEARRAFAGRSSTVLVRDYRVTTKAGLAEPDAADRSGDPANFESRSAPVPRPRRG